MGYSFQLFQNIHENRNRAILVGCLILVVYIGGLIFFNYEKQKALQTSALEGFRLDLERQAASLGYFFSERKYDVSLLVNRKEIASYFINRNLGMSEEYGLKVSLFLIHRLFDATRDSKAFENRSLYDRILLLDGEGRLLVEAGEETDAMESEPEPFPLLAESARDPIIICRKQPRYRIILAAPCFHQEEYVGELQAWLSLETFFNHFVRFTQPISSQKVDIICSEGWVMAAADNDAQQDGYYGSPSLSLVGLPTSHFATVSLVGNGREREKHLGIRLPIRNTPLFLTALIPATEIYGPVRAWHLLIATAAIAFLIVFGMGLLIRFNTLNLILRARYEEATKQQDLLEDKNSRLSEEIERRKGVERELLKNQDVIEEQKKQLQKSIDRTFSLAYYDTLTGLPNRQLCLDRISQALSAAHRKGGQLALLFLDVDRFKNINDTLGHANGDRLLQSVALRLKSCLRESDTVARFGGDEFILLLQSVNDHYEVIQVAQKVLDRMDHHFELDGHDVYTTVSIGVVLYPDDGDTSATLLKHADMAMYAAKARGRNNFQFFSGSMNQEALQRRDMEIQLRQALEREEFSLLYQPQWNTATGKIIGVEALLRWRHPELGMIAPSRFIRIAEETGLIIPIGEWVLSQVVRQALLWRDKAEPPVRLAVNLSGRQIFQPNFVEKIDMMFAESGLAPSALEFEVTENVVMENAPRHVLVLNELKKRGIRITIDDFGTGYSSLSYLKNFPIDRIKIDQGFVRDLEQSANDAAIIEAIVAVAKSLDLQVVAEGVETKFQRDFLAGQSCFIMQGYYFSRPLNPEDLLELIKSPHIA